MTAHRQSSIPELRTSLSARMLRGRNGHRIRSALVRRLPLRRHARDRMAPSQRCIPEQLVRIVIQFGRAQDVGLGVRLSLRGVRRPAAVAEALWKAALPVVVPLDEYGFVPTVFRDRSVR